MHGGMIPSFHPPGGGSTPRLNLSDFSKKCAYGTPELGAGLATGGAPGGTFGSVIRLASSRGDHACLERAGRCQSANRCLRYVEAPSHVCLRFAISKPLHGFPPLMRRQSCRSPEFHATSLCSCSALSCAGDD